MKSQVNNYNGVGVLELDYRELIEVAQTAFALSKRALEDSKRIVENAFENGNMITARFNAEQMAKAAANMFQATAMLEVLEHRAKRDIGIVTNLPYEGLGIWQDKYWKVSIGGELPSQEYYTQDTARYGRVRHLIDEMGLLQVRK